MDFDRKTTLRNASISDVISVLENLYPVHEWTMGDIDLWPVIKCRIQQAKRPSVHNSRSLPLRRIVKLLTSQLSSLLKWFLLPPTESIVLTHPTCLRYRKENLWVNAVMDPLIINGRLKNTRVTVLEFIGNKSRPGPTLTPTLPIDLVLLFSRFLRKTPELRMNTPMRDEIRDVITSELKVFFEDSFIEKTSEALDKCSRTFSRLFYKLGVRSIYFNAYYSWECFAATLAANRMGLKTYDVQHGLQGPGHGMYGDWQSWQKKPWPTTMPSKFLCRSVADVENINRWAGDDHAEILSHLETTPLHLGSAELMQAQNSVALKLSQSRFIQNILLAPNAPESILPDFLWDTIRRNPSWGFWLRLHPAQKYKKNPIQEKALSQGITNLDLDFANSVPLEALFPNFKFVIGDYSTVLQEATDYGVTAISCHEKCQIYLQSLIDAGCLIYARDKEILELTLSSSVSSRCPR